MGDSNLSSEESFRINNQVGSFLHLSFVRKRNEILYCGESMTPPKVQNLINAVKKVTKVMDRMNDYQLSIMSYASVSASNFLNLRRALQALEAETPAVGGDDRQDMRELLFDVSQLLRGWNHDGSWSEWDKSVLDAVEKMRVRLDSLNSTQPEQETQAVGEEIVTDSTETPSLSAAAKRCEMNYDSSDSHMKQTVRFHRYWAFVHGANWQKSTHPRDGQKFFCESCMEEFRKVDEAPDELGNAALKSITVNKEEWEKMKSFLEIAEFQGKVAGMVPGVLKIMREIEARK
jgi:hypothetical protein